MNSAEARALLGRPDVIDMSDIVSRVAIKHGIVPVLPDYGVFFALGFNENAYRDFLIARGDHGSDVDPIVAKMVTFHKAYTAIP